MTSLTTLARELDGTPVLVTGATGRIGRRLVSVLSEASVPVRLLTRERQGDWPGGMEAVSGDLTRPDTLLQACRGVRLILHLASHAPAPGEPRPEEGPLHRRVTVEGTRNLLLAARQAKVPRLVFASSTRVLDGSTSGYALAKREAEQLLEASRPWLQAVILRLPPVYGFAREGFVAQLVQQARAGRLPPLPDFGERRALVHVDDVVQALLLAATRPLSATHWTVTDLEEYSMQRICRAIYRALGKTTPRPWPRALFGAAALAGEVAQRITGRPMPIDRKKLHKLQRSAWFDGRPFAVETGFRPAYTLEKALPGILAAQVKSPVPRTP